MRIHSQPTPNRPVRRHVMMAVVLAAVGLWAGARDAAGATVSAAEAGAASDHLCKCKTCQGASSCCCAHPKDAPAPAKRPAPSPGKAVVSDAGPCVGSAPCDGSESTPASPTGVTVGKVARLISAADLRPPAVDQPLGLGAPARLPERVPSRLDEPPEVSSRS